jgi:cytochrome b561
MNVIPRYTRTAMLLHWLIAVLIIAGFILGLVMTDIPGFTMAKLKYYSWHKWIGVTVFMLAIARVAWRSTHTPPPQALMPAWQEKAALVAHWLLYFLIFAVPLSGYFYSLAAGVPVVYFGVIPLPVLIAKNEALRDALQLLHVTLNYTMAGLVGIHSLAALKHQFFDRDGTLARMLPFLK